MGLLSTWERGESLGIHVCLLLSPTEWDALRSSHRCLHQKLPPEALKWLFARRLCARVDGSTILNVRGLPEQILSLTPLLSFVAALDVVGEVLDDVTTYPKLLLAADFDPVRSALRCLRNWSLQDRQLMPKERSGKRSSLPRRLLRSFAALIGLMPRLVAVLKVFPSRQMPKDVFVIICEVLASLMHNARESKWTFVSAGGLAGVQMYLLQNPTDASMQAAGLAAMLALSARSVICIRSMVEAGSHEIAAAALKRFPDDPTVVARALGLLANMSNVPCVCPDLQKCGVADLARILLGREELSTPFVRDFIHYLLSNMQENVV